MRIIVQYLINMFPYMLLSLPVYLLARFLFLKTTKTKCNPWREAAMLAFVLFSVGLASQTLIPKFEFGITGFRIVQDGIHQTNLIPFKVLFETAREVFVRHNVSYFLINFAGNIVLFVPFGIFIPLLWKPSAAVTVLIGASISLTIELGQLFLARGTDIDDLLLNTAGVLLGVWIFRLLAVHVPQFLCRFQPIILSRSEATQNE